MQLQSGKLNITIDGQFGSTGKGALNAWLATHNVIDLAISNAAPNAGHTFDLCDGKGKRVAFHLPISGIVNENSIIYLCAGAIIDPEILRKEIEEFDCHGRVFIHPRAMVLQPHHTKAERNPNSGATKLGSTQKGVGAALADKISRSHNTVLAQSFIPFLEADMVHNIDVNHYLERGDRVLMEVPQGYGLSINHGFSYPHCTSRDITIGSALNDAGVHPSLLGTVIASIRTYPIRVGHVYDGEGQKIGDSGPFWPDSEEKTWGELGLDDEVTTVTKRVRRVATFSMMQYEDMVDHLRPDYIFLNFTNYLKQEELDVLVTLLECHTPKLLFGYGPSINQITESYSFLNNALYGNNTKVTSEDDFKLSTESVLKVTTKKIEYEARYFGIDPSMQLKTAEWCKGSIITDNLDPKNNTLLVPTSYGKLQVLPDHWVIKCVKTGECKSYTRDEFINNLELIKE